MAIGREMFIVSVAAALAVFPVLGRSQSPSLSKDSPEAAINGTSVQPSPTYLRPTERQKASNFVFDAFGPYPLVVTAFGAGINQANNTPPEWHQGAEAYGKRFGSDFGIAAVSTTTRFGLSEALREDAMYYRCQCSGVLPRVRHALVSTLTARRGEDGHRVFSVPALVAPYAGSMTAIYGWYPSRYGAKDAFRTGNYSLLAYAGGNIALEFIYHGSGSLLARMHLTSAHGAPDPGPSH
jgi:hypothetical protein